MGDKCRLTLCFAGVLALQAALACSRDETIERRRQLLQASGRAQARQERIDKARVRSPEGDLLPSEEKVAGFVVPRGFKLQSSKPHQWVYDAYLPQGKVEEYFDKRLTAKAKLRQEGKQVLYDEAREKSDPNHVAGWVRILPTSSKRDWTTIMISEPAPVPPNMEFPSPEQLAKQRILR